jgi:hypothetical protein
MKEKSNTSSHEFVNFPDTLVHFEQPHEKKYKKYDNEGTINGNNQRTAKSF